MPLHTYFNEPLFSTAWKCENKSSLHTWEKVAGTEVYVDAAMQARDSSIKRTFLQAHIWKVECLVSHVSDGLVILFVSDV